MAYTTDKFGINLRILRKQKGLTQQDMAEIINTSRSCISNYESGNRQPDNEIINLLADYFSVSIDYLLGRSTVKTVFKSENDMSEMNKALFYAETSRALDVSKAPPHIKCAVAEFYNYLQRKEKAE